MAVRVGSYRSFIVMATLLSSLLSLSCQAAPAPAVIPLQGEWGFRLDPENVGVSQGWFRAPLPQRAKLPGSTDENGYGTRNTRPPDLNHLSRIWEYAGPAWYQREVEVPDDWNGKRITLFLERCHWESRVWVDDRPAGMQDSLCVPHVYDLTHLLSPGKHRLSLRIDNTIKYDVGDNAHSVTEQTQTNWNGVIGRIELRASDPVWIEDLQAYPNVDAHVVRVRITVGNLTGNGVSGHVTLAASWPGAPKGVSVAFSNAGERAIAEAEIPFGPETRLWSEFSPALYQLSASLSAGGGSRTYRDERLVTIGIRKLGTINGRELAINGRRAFMRGTLECCIFPLTGYPPTTIDPWLRIFRIARSYGLNHMRFHSWCPPEAAFAAADKTGFLLHVEAPQWVGNVGRDAPRDRFVQAEVERILDAYGNHPSFGMLCMGNELGGDPSYLSGLVRLGQARDPRHLYTSSTAWSHVPENDYNVVVVRGLHGPTTDADFRTAIASSTVPTISHEVGQWTIYPNLEEIRKYTGVLRPRNFELIRSDLANKHMLDQAPAFTRASGKFMLALYKEEIEVLLRTPGHSGFQLLDLHDFPGQGTALVGTLDPFWDSKGLIAPARFRRFCGPTVPLLRMKKRTFTTDETFAADAEVSHFGAAALSRAVPEWVVKDANGSVLAHGALSPRDVPTGALTPLGRLEVPLATMPAPCKLTVTLSLRGTDAANDWEIWVYPARVETSAPDGVVVSRAWDDATRAALAAGKSVLLLASAGTLVRSIQGSFTPVFWSPVWFRGGAGTMSILCNPRHPALAAFPTDEYTNWQWYDLLQGSRSVVLDSTPAGYRPIVQVIDNFSRNHKLGNLFEAKVGPGRLLVCSLNLSGDLQHRPAARQMLHSLLAYVGSRAFRPSQELDGATLSGLFRNGVAMQRSAQAPNLRGNLVLHVKAAVRVPKPETPEPWRPEADEVLVRQDGYDYSVRGSTWRDSVGAAWHDSSELVVRITCPKGFTGKLYAHFHDWNNLNRVAELTFQGADVGTLDAYNGPGAWVTLAVTARDSANGVLELAAQPSVANVMITEVALVGE